MLKILDPKHMNRSFADGFNRRSLADLLSLYEPDARFKGDLVGPVWTGKSAIEEQLTRLLTTPGTMQAVNNFCIEHGDLALLRADWRIRDANGRLVAAGSSVELVRRQADGCWLYVIDHALGSSMPRVA